MVFLKRAEILYLVLNIISYKGGISKMPAISYFYGIVIKMYFMQNEHNPPHIHAIYGEYMSAIDIVTGKVLEGDLPNKALNLVTEWIKLYKEELLQIWKTQNFQKLPPLL